MKKLILFLSVLNMTLAIAADKVTPLDYQACLNSIHDDGNSMIPELDENTKVVYQKKSLYDRELFLIDQKHFYSCGELSIQSTTSTSDVLNYDLDLSVNNKSYSLFVEIPIVLTYGVEDIVFRDSNKKDFLDVKVECKKVKSEVINSAFIETVSVRLNSFPLLLKDSAETKRNQERNKIWGKDWKATKAINSERNNYLKVLNICSKLPFLNETIKAVKTELLSI